MKFKFLVVVLAVTSSFQLFGYSWAIKNGTDKDIYIHLTTPRQDGIAVAGLIGRKGAGVLLKKGASNEGSIKFKEPFRDLVIADNQELTANKHVIKLGDVDHNINYTIQRSGKRYKLQENK